MLKNQNIINLNDRIIFYFNVKPAHKWFLERPKSNRYKYCILTTDITGTWVPTWIIVLYGLYGLTVVNIIFFYSMNFYSN